MSAGSTTMTWSYSRPLARLAGSTRDPRRRRRRRRASRPDAGRGQRGRQPVDGGVGRDHRDRTLVVERGADLGHRRRVRGRPTDRHVAGRRRGAATPPPGTSTSERRQQAVGQRRRPPPAPGSRWSAATTAASGLPRWASVSRQSRAAHGAVPWARSPSRVIEPCSLRRAMARHCIGDRSCASSTTTWPKLGQPVDQPGRLVDAAPRRRRDHLAAFDRPGWIGPEQRGLLRRR